MLRRVFPSSEKLIGRLVFLALALFFLPPLRAEALTLQQVYEAAQDQSERSQITELQTRRAEELRSQALGTMLPSLQLNYRVLAQDIPPTRDGAVPSAFRQEHQTTAAVSLVQPLFRGGAEYASLKMARLSLESATQAERVFDFELWEQLAESFYGVLSLQREYGILEQLRSTLRERVTELQRRARIGQTRRSDLLSARAQAQATEADLLAVQTQIQATRRALETRSSVQVTGELQDSIEVPEQIPELSFYLEKLRAHPSLEVARLNVELADQSRKVEASGRLPQLDLQGNYYLERPGVLEDSKWDVSLSMTLPLFRGGVVSSRVRDSVYARTQRELELSLLQRQMDALLKNRYEDALRAQAALKNLRDSVELYRQSYNLLNQEYRSGIISYLEVNPTEREYWESLRRLQHQESELKLAWVRLQASVGERP